MALIDEDEDDLEFERKLALRKVAQKGMLLAMFPDFLADREVVSAAVRQNPDAIELASPLLQNDPEMQKLVKHVRESGPEVLHWNTQAASDEDEGAE